eukprot:5628941-Amphidinium_carterae.1
MARTQVVWFENRLGGTACAPPPCPCLVRAPPCIALHQLLPRWCRRQDAGRAQSRKALETRHGCFKFGERVLGFPVRAETGKKKDVEPKAIPGLYIGHTGRTATALLLTPGGVKKVRGVARMSATERWDYK